MKKFLSLTLILSSLVVAGDDYNSDAQRAGLAVMSPAFLPGAVAADVVTVGQEDVTERYVDSMRREPKHKKCEHNNKKGACNKCEKKRTHYEGHKNCHKDDKGCNKCQKQRTHFEGHKNSCKKNDACKSCNKPCKKENNNCRRHCIAGRAAGDHHHGDEQLTNHNKETKCHHRGNCHCKNHDAQQRKNKQRRAFMDEDDSRMSGNRGGEQMDMMVEDMWAQ